jgi:hypothetical protein
VRRQPHKRVAKCRYLLFAAQTVLDFFVSDTSGIRCSPYSCWQPYPPPPTIMQSTYPSEKAPESPTKDLDIDPDACLPEVPLSDVERSSKSRYTQLLAVIVAGVALFSDGYNIQVTGESCRAACH